MPGGSSQRGVLTPQMIDAALEKAAEHARNGRFAEAENICRRFLALSPDHVPSLHLLGSIALSAGRYADAIDHFGRAASVRAEDADLRHLLGLAQLQSGRRHDAV